MNFFRNLYLNCIGKRGKGAKMSEQLNDDEIHESLKNILDIVEMHQERNFVSSSELLEQLAVTFATQLNTDLYPTSVPTNYVGVHLGELYEDSDFNLLVKSFKNNQTLDAFYAIKIFQEAERILSTMPSVRECNVPSDANLIIVGDLHGNFNDLNHLIEKFDTPGKNCIFLFNGDFVVKIEVFMKVFKKNNFIKFNFS